MYLERLIIKRFGKTLNSDLKFNKGLNIIDCGNKREVAAAYCLVMDETFAGVYNNLFTPKTEIVAKFSDGGEKVTVIITRNGKIVITNGNNAKRYENVFVENARRNTACYFFPKDSNTQDLNIGLAKYKDEEVCFADAFIKKYGVKAFSRALNVYIRSVKPELISDEKNIYLGLQIGGNFTVFKGGGEKTEIDGQDKAVFDYYCFLIIRNFWQELYRTKDMNYPEIPLLIAGINKDADNLKKELLINNTLKYCGQVLSI